jgi:hypothetical protein
LFQPGASDTFQRLKERLDQLAGTMFGGEQAMISIGRRLMAATLRENAEVRAAHFAKN